MATHRVKKFGVSAEVLVQLLRGDPPLLLPLSQNGMVRVVTSNLPEDFEIVYVGWEPTMAMLIVFGRSETFDEVDVAADLPLSEIRVTARMVPVAGDVDVAGKYETHGYLDVNDRHPELYGECILLRDDDGIGFSLGLESFIGKHIKLTLEEAPAHGERLWRTDSERLATPAPTGEDSEAGRVG